MILRHRRTVSLAPLPTAGATLLAACLVAVGCSTAHTADAPRSNANGNDSNDGGVNTGGEAVNVPPVAPDQNGQCSSERKLCGGQCASKTDPQYGCDEATCTPCAVDLPANAVTACTEMGCGFACKSGYFRSGSSCATQQHDSWTVVTPMPIERYGHAAVTASGRIVVLGGRVYALQGSAEAYDPSTDLWSVLPDIPSQPLYLAAVAVSSGRIFALGGNGVDGASDITLSTVEAYDPSMNTWFLMKRMPTRRAGLAAAVSHGRIFAIGGATGGSGATALSTVEAYDPETDSWQTVAPMPTPRSNLAAAVAPDGRIFAIGGDNATGSSLSTVEVYDPSTNTWQAAASMLTGRELLAAVTAPDGRIFVIGGTGATTIDAYLP